MRVTRQFYGLHKLTFDRTADRMWLRKKFRRGAPVTEKVSVLGLKQSCKNLVSTVCRTKRLYCPSGLCTDILAYFPYFSAEKLHACLQMPELTISGIGPGTVYT